MGSAVAPADVPRKGNRQNAVDLVGPASGMGGEIDIDIRATAATGSQTDVYPTRGQGPCGSAGCPVGVCTARVAQTTERQSSVVRPEQKQVA